MKIECVWEHNGGDTLLHAANLPGAYARGASLEIAARKMPSEVRSYLKWKGESVPEALAIEIVQDAACALDICDADSAVLFEAEKPPLAMAEYAALKALALKSAADFLALYQAVPDPSKIGSPLRKTFYGQVPRTASEMYTHTQNVNAYYIWRNWRRRGQRGKHSGLPPPGLCSAGAEAGFSGQSRDRRELWRILDRSKSASPLSVARPYPCQGDVSDECENFWKGRCAQRIFICGISILRHRCILTVAYPCGILCLEAL